MESLDLQTGYKGVIEKREARLASLAAKYTKEIIDFEEEERKVDAEVTNAARNQSDWLKDSIRHSIAQWKQTGKQ